MITGVNKRVVLSDKCVDLGNKCVANIKSKPLIYRYRSSVSPGKNIYSKLIGNIVQDADLKFAAAGCCVVQQLYINGIHHLFGLWKYHGIRGIG